MKISRLVIVALVALILSAPATASVSVGGGYDSISANLSSLASVVTELR